MEDNNSLNIPERYTDLEQDELKLLLYFNAIQLQSSNDIYSQEYYQKKIDYITSLLEE